MDSAEPIPDFFKKDENLLDHQIKQSFLREFIYEKFPSFSTAFTKPQKKRCSGCNGSSPNW